MNLPPAFPWRYQFGYKRIYTDTDSEKDWQIAALQVLKQEYKKRLI